MSTPSTTTPLGMGVTGLTLDMLAERIAHERETRNDSISAVEKAREIQAREYERRLETLNGEAGRIRSVQEASIPREVFDTYKDERLRAQTALEESLADKRDGLVREFNVKVDTLRVEVRAMSDTLRRAEGSVATWRYLSLLLGASGIGGVVLLFATGKS